MIDKSVIYLVTYSRFNRTRLASLAIERTISISRVIAQSSICFNHTLTHRTTKVSSFGQTTRVSIHGTVEHDESDVQNSRNGNDGGVAKSSELAQKGRRENDKHSGNDQQPLTI